jgi:hypothetical protein
MRRNRCYPAQVMAPAINSDKKQWQVHKSIRIFSTQILSFLLFALSPISCLNILFHMIQKYILTLIDLLYEPYINF